MSRSNIISRGFRVGIAVLTGLFMTLVLTGCRSFIFDDEGDCSVHYRVSFRYSRNILNADAFGPQVTDVRLWLFDQDGVPVFSRQERRELSADNDFYIEVDVPAGRYDIVAWCGGDSPIDGAVSFAIGGYAQASAKSDLTATLPLESEASLLHSRHDITPLYYGMAEDVEFPDTYGIVDIDPVMLVKDTNHITLQLLNTDGSHIDPSIIDIRLEGANGSLDCSNLPTGDRRFDYRPWSLRGIEAEVENGRVRAGERGEERGEESARERNEESGEDASSSLQKATGIQAELTTGRLMAGMEQTLTIRRTDTGETIIRIPLIEYLMLVRSEYEVASSDQDYLDRYDGYSMVFFMANGYTWIKSRILINGWRVVPPQTEEV